MLEAQKKTSHWQRYALIALIGLSVLGTVFGAGFFVGRWRGRTSGAPASAAPTQVLAPGGHGALGNITQIEATTLTIQTREGTTQTIVVDAKTRIERGTFKPTKLTLHELKVGDRIIVVGRPNAQGYIKANVIRVLVAPVLTPTPTGL